MRGVRGNQSGGGRGGKATMGEEQMREVGRLSGGKRRGAV